MNTSRRSLLLRIAAAAGIIQISKSNASPSAQASRFDPSTREETHEPEGEPAPLESTFGNGRIVRYDSFGRVKEVIEPSSDGTSTHITYSYEYR